MEATQLIEKELKRFITIIVPMMKELGLTDTEIVESALSTVINDNSEAGAKAREWTIQALTDALKDNKTTKL